MSNNTTAVTGTASADPFDDPVTSNKMAIRALIPLLITFVLGMYVDMMGGTISVQSKKHEGTRFTVPASAPFPVLSAGCRPHSA